MRRFLMLSLVLGACGDDGGVGRLPDAAPISDAPADGATQPVTLTVTRNGTPVAGVHVYFLNSDDTVVSTADTDAAGTASAVMAAGGSVTAIDPFPVIEVPQAVAPGNNNDLRTFVGVKPGDHLTLTQNDPQSVGVTILAPDVPAANSYEVHTSCGSGSIPVRVGSAGGNTVTLSNCGTSADFVLVANDAEIGAPISFLYHPNADLSTGSVDLTADAVKPISVLSFNYTNIPQGTSSIYVVHTLVTARGPLQLPFEQLVAFEGDFGGATIREPTIAGAKGIVDTQVQLNGLHHVIDWGAVAATYSLDMTGLLLPDLIDQPTYDATKKGVAWTVAEGGATADFAVAQLEVGRNDGLQSWRWTVAAPYTAGQIAFPKLPTDVFDWTPVPDTDFIHVRGVTMAKTPGGYDAARAHVLDAFEPNGRPPTLDARELAAGATGRAVIEDMSQPPAVRRR